MPISGQKATALAKKHNLTLSDARALRELADDEDHAEKLAQDFAGDIDYSDLAGKLYRGEPA